MKSNRHCLNQSIMLLASIFLFFVNSYAQSIETLKSEIQNILFNKDAVVGLCITGSDGGEIVSINGDKHLPMQSVFKFHIAVAMLAAIDEGRFTLDQKIAIGKKDLLPGLYSPLRETYPNGASLGIDEILTYTVSQSDNVGCDVLLRLLGGPAKVEAYFRKHGFYDIDIKINEEVMQNNWDKQFLNWTTAKESCNILKSFYDNNPRHLSATSHAFLWKIMKETSTGVNRLKGKLPKGTVVAHKTGWSGTNKKTGITAAVNDIGLVFLPDGRYYYISVLVSDSKEDDATNEKIIADISKAAWDYFIAK